MSRDYLSTMRRHWIIVVTLLVLGGLLGAAASALATRQYTSTSSIFFSTKSASSATDLNQGSAYTQQQITSYALLAKTTPVLRAAIDDLQLKATTRQLAGAVDVSTPPGTVFMDISVTDPSKTTAAALANAIAENVAIAVEKVAPSSAGRFEATVAPQIVQRAVPSNSPTSPRTSTNVLLGLLAGLVLGIIVAAIRESTSPRIRTQKDVESLTDVPVLAQLQRGTTSHGEQLHLLNQPNARGTEPFRQLSAAYLNSMRETDSLGLLIAPVAGEDGAASVAGNLAIALSETGARVILVDGGLRHPEVADLFHSAAGGGLASLSEGASLDAVIVPNVVPGLDLLPAGDTSRASSAVVSAPSVRSALRELRGRYDVVLVLAAPVLAATDAVILSRDVDSVLLVVNSGSPARSIQEAVHRLRVANAVVSGIALDLGGRSKPAPRSADSSVGTSNPRAPRTARPTPVAARRETGAEPTGPSGTGIFDVQGD